MVERYTEEQIAEMIELSQQIGIRDAIRELGFPKSRRTVYTWLEKYNIEVDLDSVRSYSRQYHNFYEETEQLIVLNALLDRIMEKLQDINLSADEMAKLANSASKTIETMRLVGDKPTQVVQNLDSMDAHLQEMINEVKAANTLKQQDILSNE